jgi:very-short-patch-repair endonuclease
MRHTAALVANGIRALRKRTPEQRKQDAANAGRISAQKHDPAKSSRFTNERWNQLTREEQQRRVKKASAASHELLKDPVHAAARYAKIFAQAQLGYMSKAHAQLHGLIEQYGFESHVQISAMQVDECNRQLKIVVEYNGDMWHCNPKTWRADQYNTIIKMTAGEKWAKDRARYAFLRRAGYTVIVIWESGWKLDPQKYIDRIKDTYDEISKQKEHSERNVLRPVST